MSAPDQVSEATEVKEAGLGPTQPGSRLLSLDVFRGLSIVLMLLVNNSGDWHYYYAPLTHADWHGFHLADLAFPSFMFIMGVSLVYALAAVRPDAARHRRALGQVARRVAVLVALGLLIGLVPNFYFTSFRIIGVLQRLGVVYGICAVVFLKTNWRRQALLAGVLLVLYAVLLQVVPVPGFGPANLGKATNLGAWLDRLLIGQNHLYREQEGWDLESVLGLVPSVATGILGLLAGQWLRHPQATGATKAVWLFVGGSAALVVGLIWNGWFPINKSLWTSSYVLYTAGLGSVILAALYFLCDVQNWRGAWTWPLVACGSNALLVFFVPEALERFLTRFRFHHADGATFYARDWLYEHWRPLFASPYHASLGWAVAYTALWVGILAVLYRRRIFFTA